MAGMPSVVMAWRPRLGAQARATPTVPCAHAMRGTGPAVDPAGTASTALARPGTPSSAVVV